MRTELTLFYPGLKIVLYGTPAGRNFRVARMEVTSQTWEVPLGVNIGMEEVTVQERLGEPRMGMAESGGLLSIYVSEGNTAIAALIFRGRRLVSIEFAIICGKLPNFLNRPRK